MIGCVNYGRGRRTRLTIVGVCSRRPLPMYIQVGGGGELPWAPQVGGILLGGPIPILPPFLLPEGGKREEREEEGKAATPLLPLLFGLFP